MDRIPLWKRHEPVSFIDDDSDLLGYVLQEYGAIYFRVFQPVLNLPFRMLLLLVYTGIQPLFLPHSPTHQARISRAHMTPTRCRALHSNFTGSCFTYRNPHVRPSTDIKGQLISPSSQIQPKRAPTNASRDLPVVHQQRRSSCQRWILAGRLTSHSIDTVLDRSHPVAPNVWCARRLVGQGSSGWYARDHLCTWKS